MQASSGSTAVAKDSMQQQQPTSASPPIMPAEPTVWSAVKNEYENPTLFWRNFNALLHVGAFLGSIMAFREFGWMLGTQ